MFRLTAILSLCAVMILSEFSFCGEIFIYDEMKSYMNTVGNANIVENLELKNSSTSCWRACHRNSRCSSYFENKASGECRLISTNLTSGDVVEATGWKYFVKIGQEMQTEINCPTDLGFIYADTSNLCFKLLTESKIYRPAAIENCTGFGGRLLQIKNELQHDAVANYMETYYPNKSPIIDGRRPDNVGQNWTFENGEPLTFFKWGGSQPANNKCIKLSKGDSFNWATATCSVLNWYLCEIP